jgi:O-methyltransferase
MSEEAKSKIIEQCKPYTMIPDASQAFNIEAVVDIINKNQEGVIVECGTWKGGASIAMLLAQKHFFGKVIKPVYLLDSFEGLPEAKVIDGPLANRWQENKESPQYFNNCASSQAEVEAALISFGFVPGEYFLIKGWFDQTTPMLKEKLQTDKIALLRLDGDWYESTRVCLENLMPLVTHGGTVIIDDYYAWDGCAVAVNEYLGKNKLPFRIKTMQDTVGAYFYAKSRDGKAL